jgi:hypothetical protein
MAMPTFRARPPTLQRPAPTESAEPTRPARSAAATHPMGTRVLQSSRIPAQRAFVFSRA